MFLQSPVPHVTHFQKLAYHSTTCDLQDGTVVAVLSRGPERHDVPAVAGRTLDAAQQALLDARLGFGEAVERFSPEVPKGQVVTSDPVAGTALRRDAAVDLVVSKGPRPIKVRDWTGEDADEAQAALEKRGFEVEVSEENSDSVDAGTVIDTASIDDIVIHLGAEHQGVAA